MTALIAFWHNLIVLNFQIDIILLNVYTETRTYRSLREQVLPRSAPAQVSSFPVANTTYSLELLL